MDITLQIYHHHFMSDKRHHLKVKIKSVNSILELKEAISQQFISKINYFIAPPQFQSIILHGKIFDDLQTVQQLVSSSQSNNNNNTVFPTNIKQGQIILLQWPRTDLHLRQIHNVITDSSSKEIHPFTLCKKLKISMTRFMKIIHFLESAGCVRIESAPHINTHLNHLSRMEEEDNNQSHLTESTQLQNVSPSHSHSLSFSLSDIDTDLLRSFLTTVNELSLAQQLLALNDDADDDEQEHKDDE